MNSLFPFVLLGLLATNFAFAGSFESSKAACLKLGSDEDMSIRWQAFKTPSRIGVWVDFTNFTRQGNTQANNLEELLLNQQIVITAGENGLESGDEGRDFNIVEFFFKNMSERYMIRGKITGVYDDRIDIEIAMNNQTKTIPFNYEHKRGKLTLTGHIDVLDFELAGPLGQITKYCGVHLGKTWSDVEIQIQAVVTNC